MCFPKELAKGYPELPVLLFLFSLGAKSVTTSKGATGLGSSFSGAKRTELIVSSQEGNLTHLFLCI